jgi:CRP/FNR family transcriptional regulator, anaerobic regulatory protein
MNDHWSNTMESMFHKVECQNCRLAGLCLPSGLQKDEVSQLERIIKRKPTLKSEDYLYRQGDTCQSLYAVKTGSFRNFILNEDGSEQTIGFYLPGELMGLDALQNGKFHGSSTALETASVCELPLASLNALCTKIPRLQAQFMRIIGSQITSDHDKIMLLSNRSATERLATFLLMLSTRYSTLGFSGKEFNLSMPRHDIASFLCLSIETVSRQLGKLSESGIITIKHRGVQINRMESLKELA